MFSRLYHRHAEVWENLGFIGTIVLSNPNSQQTKKVYKNACSFFLTDTLTFLTDFVKQVLHPHSKEQGLRFPKQIDEKSRESFFCKTYADFYKISTISYKTCAGLVIFLTVIAPICLA